jgi:hypothetical protein
MRLTRHTVHLGSKLARAALIVLLVVLGSFFALEQPVGAAPHGVPAHVLRGLSVTALRIDAFGDSLLDQDNFYLQSEFDPATTTVDVHAIAGTALCDWVYPGSRTTATGVQANPSPGAILQLRRSQAPTVAILEFAGNDFTPCIANTPFSESSYLASYRINLRAAIGHLLAIGTKLVLVDAGPPTRAELSTSAPVPLRQLYRSVVASYASARVESADLADGAVLTPSGGFTTTLPCLAQEVATARCANVEVGGAASNVVRSPDGVHFCPTSSGNAVGKVPGLCLAYSSGAYRYAHALASLVWHRYPTTKPTTPAVVSAVTPTTTGGSVVVSGYGLQHTVSVCFVILSFPTIDGAPFSAMTPIATSSCVRPVGTSTSTSVTATLPAALGAVVTNGGVFVRAIGHSSVSVIGLSADELDSSQAS